MLPGNRVDFDIADKPIVESWTPSPKEIALKIYRGVLADDKRRKQGHQVEACDRVLNFSFLGNPGTGKSTVGRRFAELLEAAGARAGQRLPPFSSMRFERVWSFSNLPNTNVGAE